MKASPQALNKALIFAKSHTSEILACLEAGGVIATGILSAIGMKKAIKKMEEVYQYYWAPSMDEEDTKNFERERAKAYLSSFALPGLTGLATIGLIFGGAKYNRNVRNSLIGGTAVLASRFAQVKDEYKAYQNEVIDIYGEEAHEKIMAGLPVTSCVEPVLTAGCYFDETSLDIQADEPDMLFFDNLSEKYFWSKYSKVLQAEYHMNRNFALNGCLSRNDYYRMLGLIDEVNEEGDDVGWMVDDGVYWLDFNHHKEILEAENVPFCVIDICFDTVMID